MTRVKISSQIQSRLASPSIPAILTLPAIPAIQAILTLPAIPAIPTLPAIPAIPAISLTCVCLCVQAGSVYTRDQWLHSILWKVRAGGRVEEDDWV